MSNCNYHLMNDGFDMIETQLSLLAEKIDEIEFSIDVDSLDVDLDNLERQLIILNKIKLLENIGADIMSEEAQKSAYSELVNELFADSVSTAGAGEDTVSGDGASLDEDSDFNF